MEFRNSRFFAFIDTFTPNTYICVVNSNPDATTALLKINLGNAKHVFSQLEMNNSQQATAN